jgi:general secretion pathway protein D
MRTFDRFAKIAVALALLLTFAAAGNAATRKGDKFFAEGKKAEARKEWDDALDFYGKALAEDPSDPGYDMAEKRARFQAGAMHVKLGQRYQRTGVLLKALDEFQKAYAIDPSSTVAEQELKRTLEMIERAKKKTGAAATSEERSLTPAQLAKKEEVDTLARLEPEPELRPLSGTPINLRMSNQPPKVLFDTVGKLAGINVVFDPDYGTQGGQGGPPKTASVELSNSTLEDALNYVSAMTRSFWKPLSANAIFVTQESQTKRRDYEDNVVRVFYLSNLTTPQELQEVSTVVRTVADIKKVFTYAAMNALIVRGTPDQVLLTEKLVNDLDKPSAEVVVDVVVLTTSRSRTRDLAATLASVGTSGTSAGLSTGIQFSPTNPITLPGTTTGTSATTTSTTSTTTTGATGTSTTPTAALMSLAGLAHLSTNDFAITMPGALLEAMMTDSTTKVMQSPQVRASNGQKATLKIGQKVPIASGGVQPLGGTVGGYGGLYSSFQYLDVGVNVDITPTVHDNGEVTLKVKLEISSVVGYANIAGITQPIIGQSTIEHEIRVREGEVSLLGGLMQDQDSKSTAGVPGLASIPGLKWLFSSQSIQRSQQELMIALIPHIVRTPGITALDLKSIAAGTEQTTKLSLAPQPEAPAAGAPAESPKPAAPGVVPPPAPGVVPPPAPGAKATPVVSGAPAAPPAPAQSTSTRLTFRPSSVQAPPGATFTLQLDADNARDLFAAPLHLKFDPHVLKLQEVTAGKLLSSDGQKVIFTQNILNDTGDATVNLSRLPGTGGVNGSGTLVSFTFQAAAKPGKAVVTFSELGARNSQSQPASPDIPQAAIAIR